MTPTYLGQGSDPISDLSLVTTLSQDWTVTLPSDLWAMTSPSDLWAFTSPSKGWT